MNAPLTGGKDQGKNLGLREKFCLCVCFSWCRRRGCWGLSVLCICDSQGGMWQWGRFPRFLHKLVRHWSLKLHFEQFRFWLRIRGDIIIDSASQEVADSPSLGVANSPTRRVGESLTLRLCELANPRLAESRSGYGESGSRYSNFLKFIIDLQNRPLKD